MTFYPIIDENWVRVQSSIPMHNFALDKATKDPPAPKGLAHNVDAGNSTSGDDERSVVPSISVLFLACPIHYIFTFIFIPEP